MRAIVICCKERIKYCFETRTTDANRHFNLFVDLITFSRV